MKTKSPLKSKTNWLQALNAFVGVFAVADPQMLVSAIGIEGIGIYLVGVAAVQAALRAFTDTELKMRP